MPKNIQIPSIYISYAWNPESEKIAKSIEREFNNNRAKIIRDKRDLKYKGRIKDFMKEIGCGKYVILIISNKYLRSENCMFELLQIFKNRDYYQRIFPVVLDDVKIAKAGDRLELVKYWENEAKVLDDKIRELNELSNIQGVVDDLNLYIEIRNNIARLTNILKDINTLNVERHISSDFQQLYISLENKIKTEFKKRTIFDKKIINRTIYVAVGILIILTVYHIYSYEDNLKSELSDDEKNLIKESKNKIERINKTTSEVPIESKFFTVKLEVASNMKNGKVYVDNEPANILKRDSTYIFVKLIKKKGAYLFEVKNKIGACNAQRTIEKDSIELEMSCKPIKIIPIQYNTVTLIVPSSMSGENVYVDGQKAEILDRTDISITVRLPKKSKSQHFEIKKNNKKCISDKLINKDSMNFAMNCNF